MKKIIKFFKKSKLGATAFETMVIVPLWLLTILFIGRTLIISNSRYSLAHESLAIGTIVSQSKTKAEATADIKHYLSTNNVKGITAENIIMVLLTNDNKTADDWEGRPAGSTIRVKVTINTPFDDLRFSSMEIGGQIINFFPPEFTNEFTVMLSYK